MIYSKITKCIKTKRLNLRRLRIEDASEITNICNNYNIYKTTVCIYYPYTEDDAIEWIADGLYNFKHNRLYDFAITDKKTDVIYGVITLSNNAKNNNGEIGYWIGEKFWNQGIATEAASAILEFAFKDKKYHRVYARHMEENIGSGRVMQKIGMKKEGIFYGHILKDGEFKNIVNYGIINKDI